MSFADEGGRQKTALVQAQNAGRGILAGSRSEIGGMKAKSDTPWDSRRTVQRTEIDRGEVKTTAPWSQAEIVARPG